jgi:pimeloyl-ACP methyl ester carboxylesterase
MILAQLPIALALLAWPSDVTVSPSKGERAQSFQKNLAGLKRYALETKYRRDPATILASLDQQARANPEPDVVYALAELSWVESKKHDRRHKAESIERTIDVLSYAYDYLFWPELAHARQPSDPRYRMACDLYNGALDRLVREAIANGVKFEVNGEFSLKLKAREQVFKITLKDSPWSPDDIDQIILASAFEVSGLPTINYQYGLGVPLIAVRRSDKNADGAERFYPPEMAFPLTAFVTPISKLRNLGKAEIHPELTLDLIDPLRTRNVGNPAIPVESDLTTPLAYMWSRSDLERIRWSGLLRPGTAAHRAGLMLLRPYEPGKIPVVMVHGLASTPLAWVAMVNDLLLDSRIQERYQFMLYMYPTGIPFPIAASGLRDWLQQAELNFRLPDGRPDPAFYKMVMLGHSMGGLLSHAMAVDSDQKFWELNSPVAFNQIKGPPEVLDELQRYMFFPAQPFVERVVFLAVPHRGSDLTRGVVGRVSSNLIAADDHVSNLLNGLVRDNPDAFPRRFRKVPTSIETLDPDSPYLKGLLSMKPAPKVIFHSIIGYERPEGKENTTDGVVPYKSSHFEGAASELLVQSHHGVQANPYAIMEVHRILLEHLGITLQANGPPLGRRVD